MKLLFDHNLSHKLPARLADVFPGSTQTRLLGMERAEDIAVWEYAKTHGFILVTLDSDFFDILSLQGPPPKLVWLHCGNQPTASIEKMLRANSAHIVDLNADPGQVCLEIW